MMLGDSRMLAGRKYREMEDGSNAAGRGYAPVFLVLGFLLAGHRSDEKNIRNFSTYPDEVQKIVKARPELSGNIRQRGPAAIFAGNLLLFTALLFAMGLLTRQELFCRQLFEHSAFRTGAESV